MLILFHDHRHTSFCAKDHALQIPTFQILHRLGARYEERYQFPILEMPRVHFFEV